jgi:hypothetical protein
MNANDLRSAKQRGKKLRFLSRRCAPKDSGPPKVVSQGNHRGDITRPGPEHPYTTTPETKEKKKKPKAHPRPPVLDI